MAKMTYSTAVSNAINFMTANGAEENAETIARLTELVASFEQRAKAAASNEKSKAAAKKRQEENHAAREALMATVLPVLRSVIGTEEKTAEQIYNDARDRLPADWNVRKVQYALIHELAGEVQKIDQGRNSKTYKKA